MPVGCKKPHIFKKLVFSGSGSVAPLFFTYRVCYQNYEHWPVTSPKIIDRRGVARAFGSVSNCLFISTLIIKVAVTIHIRYMYI